MDKSIKKEIRRLQKLGLRNPTPNIAYAIFVAEFNEIVRAAGARK